MRRRLLSGIETKMKTLKPSEPAALEQVGLIAANEEMSDSAPRVSEYDQPSRGWDPYTIWLTRVKGSAIRTDRADAR
jgi:hypothetical protein